MTKEEFKVKTAQLAGYELKYPRAFFTKDNFMEKCPENELFFIHPKKTNRHFDFNWWNPESNIEQAMEVLEAISSKYQYHFKIGHNKMGMMQVKLLACMNDGKDYKDNSTSCDKNVIPRLICKAVKRFMESEGCVV